MIRLAIQINVVGDGNKLTPAVSDKLSQALSELAGHVLEEEGLRYEVNCNVIVMAFEVGGEDMQEGDDADDDDDDDDDDPIPFPIFPGAPTSHQLDWWGATLGCPCSACREKRSQSGTGHPSGFPMNLN